MPNKARSMPLLSQTPFGLWLKQAREARGYSQIALADRCNATQEYISGLERGTRNPSKKMVASLVEALLPDNATQELTESTLDDALGRAFGIRKGLLPPFSARTIQYAQVYENAESDMKSLLAEAQSLLLKAAAVNGRPRTTIDNLEMMMQYAEVHPEKVRYFEEDEADSPETVSHNQNEVPGLEKQLQEAGRR